MTIWASGAIGFAIGVFFTGAMIVGLMMMDDASHGR